MRMIIRYEDPYNRKETKKQFGVTELHGTRVRNDIRNESFIPKNTLGSKLRFRARRGTVRDVVPIKQGPSFHPGRLVTHTLAWRRLLRRTPARWYRPRWHRGAEGVRVVRPGMMFLLLQGR